MQVSLSPACRDYAFSGVAAVPAALTPHCRDWSLIALRYPRNTGQKLPTPTVERLAGARLPASVAIRPGRISSREWGALPL